MNCELRNVLRVGAFALLVALCILAPISQAQNSGTIVGSVYDKTGAVVPNATVTLVNQASQDTRTTVSNGDGAFAFGSVGAGTYTVRVELKGFKTWQQTDIDLRATDKRAVNATLEVGQAAETVTVEAHTDITPVDSGARSLDLSSVDYQRLPMITRNAAELLRTLPGVVTIGNGVTNGASSSMDFSGVGAAGSSVGNGISAGGVPYRGGTQLEMDGENILDEGCDCTSIAVPNPDFVQEVKVQTSAFTADSTKGPVVINFLTKSGGSQYHGSGYFNVRNAIFNSNTWQNDHRGAPKVTGDHYYYPGGTVGGPVPGFKKKLLLWGGYEHYYQLGTGGTNLTSYIPTADMLAGNFGPTPANNALCQGILGVNAADTTNASNGTFCASVNQPAAGSFNGSFGPAGAALAANTVPVNPNVSKLWALMPLANSNPATTPGKANFFYPVPALHNGFVYRVRGDYNFDQNNKLFITWQYAKDSQPSNGDSHMWWLPGNSVPFPGGGLTNPTNTKSITGSFLHIFSPTLTNELTGFWTFYWSPQSPGNFNAVTRAAVGYPDSYGTVFDKGKPLGQVMVPGWNAFFYQNKGYSFPDFSQWDVFSNTNGSYYIKKQNPAFGDNISKVIGTHTLKTGIYYEMTGNNQGNFNPYNGGFSFTNNSYPDAVCLAGGGVCPFQGTENPTANFMMGIASNYNETNYLPLNDQAYKTYAAYLMDSWKMSKRMTWDIGFRVEHLTHWYDRSGFGNAVWLPGRVASDVVAHKEYPGIYWHSIDPGIPLQGAPVRFAFVEPRIGMAFDVFGTGKTVVRGGFGMYRFNDQVNDYGGPLSLAQQMITSTLQNNQTLLFSETGLASKPSTTYSYPSNGGFILDPLDSEVPYTKNWNLTVDQRTPWNTLLEVAYEGSSSGSLFFGGQTGGGGNLGGGDLINVNKVPLGAYFKADPVSGLMAANLENIAGCPYGTAASVCQADYHPFGQYYGTNAINVETHKGYSTYNALALIWTKQTGHLTFNTSLLWSKALGFGNGNVNPFVTHAGYTVLNIDRPYVWNSTYAYEFGKAYKGDNKIVGGAVNNWTISGFTTWQKGANLQAQTSQNLGMGIDYVTINGDGSYHHVSDITQRTFYGTDAGINIQPTELCSPTSGLASHQIAKMSCFAPPGGLSAVPTGTSLSAFGPTTLPYISMQNYFASDLAIFKSFHITERQAVEFRFSATNWMNHPLNGFSNNTPVTLHFSVNQASPTAFLPLNTAAASTWGISDTKYEPGTQNAGRTIQLGLKYTF